VITFRYHVVSIVAVLLALSAGVALGSGPLQRDVDTRLVDQARSDRRTSADLEAQVSRLESSNGFTDRFATTVAPRLLRSRLTGRAVTFLVLPTARPGDVKALERFVGVAGGEVAGTLRVRSGLVDAGEKQLVDELGNQLENEARDVTIPADAGPYDRIGALVGRAVGTRRPGGARVDNVSTTVLGALDAAKLMSADGRLRRRGDLVLLVAGPGPGDAAERKGAGSIVDSLATALDARTAGVVVAGPVESAEPDGAVAVLRADARAARAVSTVDSLGRAAGQVVTVLALAGQAAGEVGQYGAVHAADGPMPGAHGDG
jgi:Copper transport outer membrane protein, MctB